MKRERERERESSIVRKRKGARYKDRGISTTFPCSEMESKHKQSNTFIQYAQMEMKEESNIGLSLN